MCCGALDTHEHSWHSTRRTPLLCCCYVRTRTAEGRLVLPLRQGRLGQDSLVNHLHVNNWCLRRQHFQMFHSFTVSSISSQAKLVTAQTLRVSQLAQKIQTVRVMQQRQTRPPHWLLCFSRPYTVWPGARKAIQVRQLLPAAIQRDIRYLVSSALLSPASRLDAPGFGMPSLVFDSCCDAADLTSSGSISCNSAHAALQQLHRGLIDLQVGSASTSSLWQGLMCSLPVCPPLCWKSTGRGVT